MSNLDQEANLLIDAFCEAIRAECLDECAALNSGLHDAAVAKAGKALYDSLMRQHQAIGAECRIRLLDDSTESDVYISFGAFTEHHQHDGYGVHDDSIYYYASAGESELKAFTLSANADDFVILSYELVYEWPTKATYRDNGHLVTNMSSFEVRISRIAGTESCVIRLNADNEEHAQALALEVAKSDYFEPSNWKLDDEIGCIKDVKVTKYS